MLAKALGELTGREFHWGLVASLAAPIIGDIFSSNAANGAQQQAQQNSAAQQQAAIAQQENYAVMQQNMQQSALSGIADNGNPYLSAANQARPPAAYTPPSNGGQVYAGGNALPLSPQQLAAQYGGSGMTLLGSSAPSSNPYTIPLPTPAPRTTSGRETQPIARNVLGNI